MLTAKLYSLKTPKEITKGFFFLSTDKVYFSFLHAQTAEMFSWKYLCSPSFFPLPCVNCTTLMTWECLTTASLAFKPVSNSPVNHWEVEMFF